MTLRSIRELLGEIRAERASVRRDVSADNYRFADEQKLCPSNLFRVCCRHNVVRL